MWKASPSTKMLNEILFILLLCGTMVKCDNFLINNGLFEDNCLIQTLQPISLDALDLERHKLLDSKISPMLVKDVKCLAIATKANSPRQIRDLIDQVTPLKTQKKSVILQSDQLGKINLTNILKRTTLNFDLVLLHDNQDAVTRCRHTFHFIEGMHFDCDDIGSFLRARSTLRVGVMPRRFPFIDRVTRKGEIVGVESEVWKVLKRKLGVKTKFLLGSQVRTINMVSQGQADASISHPTFNWNWYQRTMVGPATFQGDIFITVKRPTVRSRLETIFYPYNLTSWIVIVISFIATLAAMILCDKILLSIYGSKGFFYNFAITLSALINDSSSRKMSLPTIPVSKMLIISLWLPSSMLLGLAYQSNLLASLIKTDFEPSINTFQDILDRPLFKVYVHNLTVVPLVMKQSPNLLVRQTYFQAVEKNGGLVNGFPKGLPAGEIMEGKAGMVMNPHTITGFRHMLQKGKQLTLDRPFSGYYFPVNFQIKPIIDSHIMSFKEMGIYEGLVTKHTWNRRRMEIWHKKYSSNYERDQAFLAKVNGNTNDQEELSIEQLFAVILILVGGLGLSVMTFVFEAGRLLCRNMIVTDLQLN